MLEIKLLADFYAQIQRKEEVKFESEKRKALHLYLEGEGVLILILIWKATSKGTNVKTN